MCRGLKGYSLPLTLFLFLVPIVSLLELLTKISTTGTILNFIPFCDVLESLLSGDNGVGGLSTPS